MARTDTILHSLDTKHKRLNMEAYSNDLLRIELQGLATEIGRYLEPQDTNK